MLPSANKFDFGQTFSITTQFGGLEIMTDIYLEQLSENSGMIVFLDRDLIGSATLPEFNIELPSNNVKKNVVQGLRIKDVTPNYIIGNCKCFDVYTSFAFIFVGIGQENGPYAILEGFSL